MLLFSLLYSTIFIYYACGVETKDITKIQLNWVTLASLPWIASEYQYLDLKSSDIIKSVTAIASKKDWANGKTA